MTDLDNSKIKVVGLGRDESTTKMVIDNLEVMGVESVWLCVDSEDFDHAKIDLRSTLSASHWLLLDVSSFGMSESLRSAAGAAMVFAELEGAKTAIIIDHQCLMNSEQAWGLVVERIRQIGFISMTSEGRKWIAEIEEVDPKDIGEMLRTRGLVSVVATLNESTSVAEIHHNLGVVAGVTRYADLTELVSNLLVKLPSSSYSEDGIRLSAGL